MIQQQTRRHADSPARWQKAAERAQAEGIRLCQLQGSGQWIATSGSQDGVAYEVAVTGNVAHGCDCLAGLNADPVCKHRAAWYLLIGALDLTPEPDPPALGVVVRCTACTAGKVEEWGVSGPIGFRPCAVCGGAARVIVPARRPAVADRIAA